MPDITMCDGGKCILRHGCYRFNAKPGDYQAYFMEPPYNEKKNECIYYWYDRRKKEVGPDDTGTGSPTKRVD